jgi:hypothetical protein
MVEPESRHDVPPWVLRSALGLCVLASVPLYMVFLNSAAHRWALQLDPGDFTRTALPFVVPAAAFSFTLLAALSWWMTLLAGKPFLLGRTGWWFLVVFVAALSLTAGTIGAKGRLGFDDVLFNVALTSTGMVGVWLVPPAVSPRLIEVLPRWASRRTPNLPHNSTTAAAPRAAGPSDSSEPPR